MIKRIAYIFGGILVVVGILGFVSGITVYSPDGETGLLLNVFAVDTLHNWVHILSGLAAIACGLASEFACRLYFKVFGVVYGLVAVLGFAVGDGAIFGVMANNMADAVLHTLIAGAALFLGFGQLSARLEHYHDEGSHHPA